MREKSTLKQKRNDSCGKKSFVDIAPHFALKCQDCTRRSSSNIYNFQKPHILTCAKWRKI